MRPLVDQVDSNKPLSIALEEIAADKIVAQYPGDARRAAEHLLGAEPADDSGTEEPGAEILALGAAEEPEAPESGEGV